MFFLFFSKYHGVYCSTPIPFPVTKSSKLWSAWPLFPHISFTLSHSPCNWNFTLKIYQQLPNFQIFVSSLILLRLHTNIGIFTIITSLNILLPDFFPTDLPSTSFCSFLVFNKSPHSLALSYMFQQFQPLLALFMDLKASFIHGQEDHYIISPALMWFFSLGPMFPMAW